MAVAERERPGHECRAEPHCVCGHTAQHHDDEPSSEHECFYEDCLCSRWQRCTAYVFPNK